MHLIMAIVLFAQVLNPLDQVQAYTTADPIDPERLGLATPDGRFAIRAVVGGGCESWLTPGQNILIYPNSQLPPWLEVSRTDGVSDPCTVRVEGRMDATPCFVNEAGLCDVAVEGGVD